VQLLASIKARGYNKAMANRDMDWFHQAEADLEHAESSAREGDYEWSCFAAQQAAEKALKALYYSLHGDPWGHSLLVLIRGLPAAVASRLPEELHDSAKALDKHYIQTRYPNGFEAGAPTDYYTKKDAEESIAHAKSILEFSRAEIRR
jgi:HEPN domain-containing protein